MAVQINQPHVTAIKHNTPLIQSTKLQMTSPVVTLDMVSIIKLSLYMAQVY